MKLVLSLLILFALAFTTTAQDPTGTPDAEPTTLMRALSLIADTPAVQDGAPVVSYGGHHDALLARGLPVPANWGFFELLGAPSAVLFSFSGAGMSEMAPNLVIGGPDYMRTVGFDFFQIEAAIEIGIPPMQGQILLGTFSADAVIAAHRARGYTVEAGGEEGTLLCPADGCDSGQKTRPAERDMSNPFGGRLGQMKPLFVGEGLIVAGDYDVLRALIAPLTTSARSPGDPEKERVLADLPAYQAVANALAAYPFVPAVMIFDPADLQPGPAPDDAAQAILDANPLPPFELIAIASGATEEPRVEDGVMLLVYADAADAETAAASIDARLELSSFITQTSYAEVFSASGTLEPAQVLTDEATGLSLVMLRVSSSDLPLEGETGRSLLAHRAFSRFMQGIINRDTLWLTTTGAE
jgi:hypothetical protein